MIDIKDLRVGQSMYEVQSGYERGLHKEEIDTVQEVTVTKVGKRYVTVKSKIGFRTFDSKEDFKIYDGYSYKRLDCALYASVQDYLDELKKEKTLKKIRDYFSYDYKRFNLLSLEELESINSIIDKY
nr:MAG TPA: hypothetical protein [Caudoviricetes sp.]